MILTEEAAKTKWCPMVRFEIGPNDSNWQGNAYTTRGEVLSPPKSVMCLASGCMWWVWVARRHRETDELLKPIRGYCGLGGKP